MPESAGVKNRLELEKGQSGLSFVLSNANIPTFLNASDLMFNFVLGLKIELSFLGKMASSFLVKVVSTPFKNYQV